MAIGPGQGLKVCKPGPTTHRLLDTWDRDTHSRGILGIYISLSIQCNSTTHHYCIHTIYVWLKEKIRRCTKNGCFYQQMDCQSGMASTWLDTFFNVQIWTLELRPCLAFVVASRGQKQVSKALENELSLLLFWLKSLQWCSTTATWQWWWYSHCARALLQIYVKKSVIASWYPKGSALEQPCCQRRTSPLLASFTGQTFGIDFWRATIMMAPAYFCTFKFVLKTEPFIMSKSVTNQSQNIHHFSRLSLGKIQWFSAASLWIQC